MKKKKNNKGWNSWLNISKTKFENNNAVLDGGAIRWAYNQPSFIKSSFLQNTAFYGKDVASFPVRMRTQFISKETGY